MEKSKQIQGAKQFIAREQVLKQNAHESLNLKIKSLNVIRVYSDFKWCCTELAHHFSYYPWKLK